MLLLYIFLLLLFCFSPYNEKRTRTKRPFSSFLHTIHQPEVDVGGDDGGEGEGDTDFEKIGVLDLVAFTVENADTSDVGRYG